jgi:hypothetical protein
MTSDQAIGLRLGSSSTARDQQSGRSADDDTIDPTLACVTLQQADHWLSSK